MKKKIEPLQNAQYLSAVLLRTLIGKSPDVRKTLDILKLRKKHVCIVINNNAQNKGMLQKVKDVVAFGEIDDSTFKLLQEKRGKKSDEKKPLFHLHPPRGGFERKGIKVDYVSGGALGYRGAAMKQLIQKMI